MIDFVKMTASGNDFIMIDNRQNRIREEALAGLVKALCPRQTSVGADGVIFIEKCEGADFRMRIFNPDASEAEMCGNGARCAARFALGLDICGKKMSFQTLAGLIRAEVANCGVRIKMSDPKDYRHIKILDIGAMKLEAHFINTGVPHTLLAVEDIAGVPLMKIGPEVRHHNEFQPAGTNVDFAQFGPGNKISVRTYERGVEGETLACGTGCVAAAIIAARVHGWSSPVHVMPQSGIPLIITFHRSGDDFHDVALEGDANFVFRATVSEEIWSNK